MITREDLEQAICECQAEREPNANTCIKLAAFYTLRDRICPDRPQTYSYAAEPPHVSRETTRIESDSDFIKAINEADMGNVLKIMDELMDTLKVINPRLYDGVMRRIQTS